MEYRVKCPDEIHIPRAGKPDRKRKLSVNVVKNAAHCWRCGFGTYDAKVFCARYGIKLTFDPNMQQQEVSTVSLRLPDEYQTLFIGRTGQQALQYLLERNITRTTISAYDIGFCEDGKYGGRIIIPFYSNEELVYFQARDFTNTSSLRYTSPSKREGAIPNRLFNIDAIKKDGVMLLTEGPLDALRIPEYAVAMVGSGWNVAKKEQILEAQPALVLLGLDNDDAGRTASKTIQEDLEGLIITHMLRYQGKDLGGISVTEESRIRKLCRTFDQA